MAQSYLISAFPDTRSPRRRPIQFPDHPRRQYHFLGLGGFPILTRCTCVHILILVAVDWDSNAPASPPQRTRSRAPQITRLLIPTPSNKKTGQPPGEIRSFNMSFLTSKAQHDLLPPRPSAGKPPQSTRPLPRADNSEFQTSSAQPRAPNLNQPDRSPAPVNKN